VETANGGRDGGLGGTGGGATSGGAMARALSFTVDGASIGAVDAFVAISLRPPATGPGTTAWRGTIRATGRASAVMGTGTGVPAVVLIFGERAGTFGAAGDKARDADVVDASTRGATGAARLGSAALATWRGSLPRGTRINSAWLPTVQWFRRIPKHVRLSWHGLRRTRDARVCRLNTLSRVSSARGFDG